ncbi:hypothetical protein C7J88_09725 [Staphylococcus muscae]|uniref:Uncharacterized protein n=1 Tax=Staphylococcus muscae TaxID=1294 RepID=A0A240C0D5_9STAP|nr:hypothetical protein [Staphylococcus muscae]AVQ34427.1 hypothetical protein C7J88_09725 [Staphylococcus muscae]PNZ02877.1 hypothetical protein CD131_07565 [Staphylococcus muscae]GGA93157.1 hypothetical protein GCM10007183_16660 [Staphylococcus muscae]SNW00763.1 Uncharacterised protein [Staphylococcus muscae]
MEKFTEYYLVEVNERGDNTPLIKSYEGNGFTRGISPDSAFKFQNEEDVKQACHFQNMLAKIFRNKTVTYYVKQEVERTKFDESGEPYVKPKVDHEVEGVNE